MLGAGRSPGLYILVVRQSMRTCHAGCAAYPYFLTCLGLVRQRPGNIGGSYSSKGIPPYSGSKQNRNCGERVIKTKWRMLIKIAIVADLSKFVIAEVQS